MKKAILQLFCFSLLILVALNSYSQSYTPLLQSGNQWNVLRDGANPSHYTEIFKVDIDTTINGKSCKKIVSSNDSSSTATYHFNCYMYEDTVTKKIYNFDSQFNQKFYFDFNAQVGDSMFISAPVYGFSSCDTFIVAEVISISVGGIDRKRITLSSFSDTTEYIKADIWIEGIGSYHGLVYGAVSPRYIGSQYNLLCFRNNNQLVYEDSIFSYCYSSNVGVETVDKPDVLLYPNPVSDVLNICNLENGKSKMQVFDSFGRLVFHQNLFEANNRISLSNLKVGMYNVLIYNDHRIIASKKIIKN
jgi:hypothetical protein